ncbi:hypothetical protein KFL_000660020 [Klebsormidium nitens]|uniref:Bromo domain-containing protein n=1 Tax=Klebsormidium nitens TaxID=105231 RepID=A0A1Y1HYH1_KLENI|nr:hypothetical protein KFL_000660020 [Klebsormidium nitens]|eukprot:GAQ80908.1 hypothetical protein KFL_000660020 [Klebsormidium nitens]
MAAHELALKLEKLGLWEKYLGEEKRRVMLKYLSNRTSWEQFLSGTGVGASLTEEHRRAEFELGMQVRCLLYGEMAVALYSADCAGSSLRPDSVYHTLDHSVDDWQRLSDEGSIELASLRHKFGLDLDEAQPSSRPGADGDDGCGERQKPRLKASREIMSLMPDVKPGKKDLLEDRQNELNDALEHVLTELKNMGEASKPFQCRVKKSEAWDYYTVIQRPMDLGTMTKKLRAYKYPSKVSFREDIDLIASNCHEYNEKDSLYVQYVDELQAKAYALLVDVPDIDVLALKSASGPEAGTGKPHPSPVRASAPSEPSSPDSNSEDEAIAKSRPGFGGFGRHQPGKKMRGKAGSIGKRLLKDMGGGNAPGEGEAEAAGPVHTDGKSLAPPGGPADPGPVAAEDGRAGGLPDSLAGGATGPEANDDPGMHVRHSPTGSELLEKSSAQGATIRLGNEEVGIRDVPVKDAFSRDVSASPRVSPTSLSQPGTQLDGDKRDNGQGAGESTAGREDDVAEARWPYGEWLQATLMQRMEHLAARAAARHVPFPEQPVLQRTPEGMARYLEEAARRGSVVSHATRAGSAEQMEPPGPAEGAGVTGLSDEPFMPELEFATDCVPDVAAVPGPSVEAAPSEAAREREPVPERPAKRPKPDTVSAPSWTDERARAALRQAAARLAAREGFDGIRRGALEVLTDLLGAHVRRLGRTLRLLEERYEGRSPEALLAMCLNGFGVRNIAELAAYTKPKEPSAAPGPGPSAGATKEAPPKPVSVQPVKASKPEPKAPAPILPVRPPSSTPQFPSVPVFKGNLPKVETDPEMSSSPSLEPEKKKAKPRAKKAAPTTSAAQSRFPGLKSPTVSPPAPTAALGLPSPAIPSYQPVVIPNTAPPSILYGGAASAGVLRSPNMAYGVPFGLSSSQPVRPVGSMGLYTSPSLDVLGQRPSKDQAGKNEG